jgi:hypothetical protein
VGAVGDWIDLTPFEPTIKEAVPSNRSVAWVGIGFGPMLVLLGAWDWRIGWPLIAMGVAALSGSGYSIVRRRRNRYTPSKR